MQSWLALRGTQRRTAEKERRSTRQTARGLAGRLLAIVIGLLLPILLLELSLRLFGPWIPGGYDTGPYIMRDERLGHRHVPGYDGWMKAVEFTTRVTISPLGLRDPRTSYEKPPGTYRIVLLGDSFVEGVQVQEQETVARQLETILNQRSSRKVEVINAGVAAYGTAQELLYYEDEVSRFQPDAVLLFFFPWNDVKNNSYHLEIPDGDLKLALKPYFETDRQGTLHLIPGPPPTPQPPVIAALRRDSWLYNVLEGGILADLGPGFVRQDIEVVGGARTPIRGLYSVESDDEWKRAWRLTQELVERLRDRTQEAGAPLVLVHVPGWEVDRAQWRERLIGPKGDASEFNADQPDRRLRALADDVAVPYVDLLPSMRQATEQAGALLYYPRDGHWTAAGHAMAASIVAEALDGLGLNGR
jgi:hypothetical protein